MAEHGWRQGPLPTNLGTRRTAQFCFVASLAGFTACGGAGDESEGGGDDGSTGGLSGDGDLGSGGLGGDGDLGTGGLGGDGDLGTGGASSSSDCSGTFGLGALFFDDTHVSSPALTGDELELFYVDGQDTEQTIKLSVRSTTSESFAIGTPVAELNALCGPTENRSIDVSEDGLRTYFSCYQIDAIEESSHQLYMASRPSRQAPFSEVVPIASFATSAAVSADELSIIGSTYAGLSTDSASRTSLSGTFENRAPLPGLESLLLFAPTLSKSGLELYRASEGQIIKVSRPDLSSPFLNPETLGIAPTDLAGVGAPELSWDCRKLLFVGVTAEGRFRLHMSTR